MKVLQGQRELDKGYGQTTICATNSEIFLDSHPATDSSAVSLPPHFPGTHQYTELSDFLQGWPTRIRVMAYQSF